MSVVADKEDVDSLLVRSRDRESLQVLVDGIELVAGIEALDPYGIRVGEGTDYPYRVTVSREAFAEWVAHEIREYVTYPNFKNEVRASLGDDWASTLNNVWGNMLRVTDDEGSEYGYYGVRWGR